MSAIMSAFCLWVAGGAGITSQPAAPAPIEITFQMPPGGPWPSNARIAATGPSERCEFSAPVAAVTSLEVGRHEVWTITAYAEGLWVDPVAVLAPGSATVRFLPAGAVAGSVALEQFESMPASIRVRFSSPEPGSPSGEESGELVLQVGKVMGEVELRYPAEQHASVLAVRSGAAIWLPPLLSWAGRFGGEGSYAPGRVVIPRLDAGVWSFCLLSPGTAEWAATWAWGRTAPDRCVEMVVAPGGRASADLRPPPFADPSR